MLSKYGRTGVKTFSADDEAENKEDKSQPTSADPIIVYKHTCSSLTIGNGVRDDRHGQDLPDDHGLAEGRAGFDGGHRE